MGGFYRMVALDGFEVCETAYGQPLLVMLSLIDHCVNMLSENFPRL
jgi:hypothetical protein